MAANNRSINRVFTRSVLGDLIQKGTNGVFNAVVQRYINHPENKTHGQIISEIYMYLGKENRNEYYYTNTLLNKLLVGKHNVNTATKYVKRMEELEILKQISAQTRYGVFLYDKYLKVFDTQQEDVK